MGNHSNVLAWLRGHGQDTAFSLLAGLLVVVLFGLLLLGDGKLSAADEPDASASPSVPALSPAPGDQRPAPATGAVSPAAPGATDQSAPPATASPAPTPVAEPMPAAEPAPTVADGPRLPLVPVVGFWSGETSLSLAELREVLATGGERFARVLVPAADAVALEQALQLELGAHVERVPAAPVARAVRNGGLGLLRLEDITTAVRAVELDGRALFGNRRLEALEEWPLMVAMATADVPEWEQSASWTLVAGGDIQLDRWMAYQVSVEGKGVDWPWDGGTVRINGRYCCSELGHRLPEWESTGNAGALRAVFSEADLAMANLEAAVIDDPSFHVLPRGFPSTLQFSGDPALLEGLQNAGFDFLSLANNHIQDAGPDGIRDTRRHLRGLSIEFAGAGRDVEQASQPARLEVGGRRVAVLPCITVGLTARADRAGAASCRGNQLVRQIRRAAEDADVVIVFPHWGREYRTTPNANQRSLAQTWAEAGADLILGAHSHWVGSIEEIGDSLVFYSLGNLAFDQPWSEPTMQGVIVELTFNDDRLVQAWLHPTLIVDYVQPNLLEYDGGGRRVIERMRDASEGLLPY